MTPRLIIFDVDGTLIDSQSVIVEAATAAFVDAGVEPPTTPQILSMVGLSLVRFIAELAPDENPDMQAEITRRYRDHFIAARAASGGEAMVPLYDGAKETLMALNGEPQTLLGTATGKARRGLDHMIESHGLHGLFTTLQTADGHPSKPDPSMIHAALDETGIDRARAVMIGDTGFDMEMGRAAGVATIGVTWGYHATDRLLAAGAERIVSDFAELRSILQELP